MMAKTAAKKTVVIARTPDVFLFFEVCKAERIRNKEYKEIVKIGR